MSFPIFKQLDAMDCGPTCLRMIAAHHGRRVDRQRLRDMCSLGKNGVSLLGISGAAERLGLRTLAVKLPYAVLAKEVPLPCIAHWEANHFVVVTRFSKKGVEVADPEFGRMVYTPEEFRAGWLAREDETSEDSPGVLLLLETTPEFFQHPSDETESAVQGLGYFFAYLKPHRRLLMQTLIALGVALTLNFAAPFLAQTMVDLGIGTLDLSLVGLILIAQLVLSLSHMAIDMLQGWIFLHVGSRISLSLIADFLNKLLKLPLSFFDTRTAGDIMQRIEDHERVNTFLTSSSLGAVFSVISFTVFGAVLAFYNPVIFAVFCVLTALSTGWIMLFLKARRNLDNKQFGLEAKEQDKYVELVNGVQEIKLQGLERQKRWEWEALAAKFFKVNVKDLALDNAQRVGASFIDSVRNIVISFLAARAVIHGEMSLGMMLSTQFIIGQLTAPVGHLVDFVHQFQDAKLSLERMLEIYGQKEEEHFRVEKSVTFPSDRELVIRELNFRYPGPGQRDVIKDLSLVIPEGKTTAIVGASGSGKTTLLKLLLGLYKPVSGEIAVGGEALDAFDAQAWRARCGVVMQDGYIFPATIGQNIACTHGPAHEGRLRAAAWLANLQEWIGGLPLGFETKIGDDGQGISGGQRQRLLLARAIYKNPEYLFLDEATSSLDAGNERTIMDHLGEFGKGRTVVIIAHRLSTVKNADQIVVLDQGQVVEQGSHRDLVTRRGHYYRLVSNQLELDAPPVPDVRPVLAS